MGSDLYLSPKLVDSPRISIDCIIETYLDKIRPYAEDYFDEEEVEEEMENVESILLNKSAYELAQFDETFLEERCHQSDKAALDYLENYFGWDQDSSTNADLKEFRVDLKFTVIQ